MAVDYSTETEEYEAVGGGDFPPTWDFELCDTVKGVYLSTRDVNTRNGSRKIHRFGAHEGTNPQGFEGGVYEREDGIFDVWGAAIINSRLENVPAGARVKIVATGRVVPTKNGRKAKEFEVLVAKGSVPGRA